MDCFRGEPRYIEKFTRRSGKNVCSCIIGQCRSLKGRRRSWEVEIDGAIWKQKTFNYQGKCLAWIKEEFNALNKDDKLRVKEYLHGTGCEILLGE